MSELMGRKLKAARKSANIKQKEMAPLLGISISTLSDYENGKVRISGNSLSIFAKACDMTVDQLLGMDVLSVDESIDEMTDEEVDAAIEKEGHELVDMINQLSPEKQAAALEILKILSRL